MDLLPDWRVYCWVCRGCLRCAGPGGKETRQRAAEIGNTVVKMETIGMGWIWYLLIVLYIVWMIDLTNANGKDDGE